MTSEELQNTLNNAIQILQDNKQVVTPEILDTADRIIATLGGPEPSSHLSLGINLDEILNMASKVIAIERRLTQTGLTDNLIDIMTRLQNHPIILAMIARLL